jgi:hypothetical protein
MLAASFAGALDGALIVLLQQDGWTSGRKDAPAQKDADDFDAAPDPR